MEQKPIINCHTHIFTGKNIPPYIGKNFMPFIFYRILTTPLIIGVFKFWFNNKFSPYKFKFSFRNSRLRKNLIKVKLFWKSFWLLRTLVDVISFLLVIFSSYLLFKFFFKGFQIVENVLTILYETPYLKFLENNYFQIFIVVFTTFAIPWGRKIGK